MLRDFLLTAYHSQIFHHQNTRDMLSFDMVQWLVNIVDAHLTGQINGAAWRQKNPKAKPKPVKEFSKGDSFAKAVMPERLRKFYQEAEKTESVGTKKEAFISKSEQWIERLKAGSMGQA